MEAIVAARQWDAEHDVPSQIRAHHESALLAIYHDYWVSPRQLQQQTESYCMVGIYESQRQLQPTPMRQW